MNNMKQYVRIPVIAFVFILFIMVTPKFEGVMAGSFSFDPTTVTATTSAAFTVTVSVATGTDSVTSADAVISYSTTGFSVGTVTPGTFFGSVTSNTQTSGKLRLSGTVGTGGTAVTGSGTLATVSFTPQTAGSYQLTFDCTDGSTTDSNIVKNDANATDVIVCTQNNTVSITISGASVTPTVGVTPTPTIAPTPTVIVSSPTPTAMPIAGANQASVYCSSQGYRSEIRPDALGAQTGYCIFQDGTACEEWAFFRSQCRPLGAPVAQSYIPIGGPIPVTGNTETVLIISGIGIAFILLGKIFLLLL